MGSPYIFAVTPTPKIPLLKNENKAARHPQGSAQRQLSKVFLIKSCSEAEGGGEGERLGEAVVSELGHCLLTAVYLTH